MSVGAQTEGQFHLIYGAEGTQALFTGLATQIVYGGCDHDTAMNLSRRSSTTDQVSLILTIAVEDRSVHECSVLFRQPQEHDPPGLISRHHDLLIP
jgi:hypothetical protein